MRMAVGIVVAIAKFLYGYVVGDDLLLAVVMGLALVATGLLVAAGINAWWLVPPLAVLMTGVHLRMRPAPPSNQPAR